MFSRSANEIEVNLAPLDHLDGRRRPACAFGATLAAAVLIGALHAPYNLLRSVRRPAFDRKHPAHRALTRTNQGEKL